MVQENTSVSARDKATSEMGRLMLSGWVLTDKVCETCFTVPLMCDKARREWVCVYCRELESRGEGTSSNACVAETVLPVIEAAEEETEDKVEIEEEEEVEEEFNVESLLSQRLMQGWCMLSQTCQFCPHVPLMRPPVPKAPESASSSNSKTETKDIVQSARMICVKCDRVYLNESDIKETLKDQQQNIDLVSLEDEKKKSAAPVARSSQVIGKSGKTVDTGSPSQPIKASSTLTLSSSSSVPSKRASLSEEIIEDTIFIVQQELHESNQKLKECKANDWKEKTEIICYVRELLSILTKSR